MDEDKRRLRVGRVSIYLFLDLTLSLLKRNVENNRLHYWFDRRVANSRRSTVLTLDIYTFLQATLEEQPLPESSSIPKLNPETSSSLPSSDPMTKRKH
jgi:hypothetical protein